MEKDFVYFVRSTTGEVPMPNTVEDAEEILPIYFSFGYSNCNTLVMIELLLGQVQKPFFYLVVIWFEFFKSLLRVFHDNIFDADFYDWISFDVCHEWSDVLYLVQF